ncbi:MAG: hypothetical protein D6766_02270 [Verrucomicrobia bacterium]|nr:MAG: hypothetical protein D6766_02270 [Verrucomicrobiota bacterium]
MAMAAAVAGCRTTRVDPAWNAGSWDLATLQPLRVVVVDTRPGARQALETAFVRELDDRGIRAETTFADPALSLDRIDADETAAARRMAEEGAGGVLLVRWLDEQLIRRLEGRRPPDIELKPYQFDPAVPVRSWTRYYDDSYAYAGEIQKVRTNRLVSLETTLYRLPEGTLLWRARTETFVPHGRTPPQRRELLVRGLVRALLKAEHAP